jgi:hypothetical protein
MAESSTLLAVRDGRVDCPTYGSVYVGRCFGCERFTGVGAGPAGPHIACRPAPDAVR